MRNDASVRKLSGAVLTYALSFGINSALPFLLLPLLTRYLTPSDYGRVAMFQVLMTVSAPLIGLSLHGAVQRFYFDCDVDDAGRQRFASFVSGAICLMIVAAAMLSALAFVAMPWVVELLDLPPAWIYVGFACSLGMSLFQIQLTIANARMRPVQYALLTNVQTLLNVAITILLVVGLRWAWQGRVISITAAAIVSSFLALWLMWRGRYLWVRPRRILMANAMIFVLPLLPHAFAQVLRTSFDRTFVNSYGGTSETGLYVVALALASLLSILGQALAQAWVPWLFRSLRDGGHSKHAIISLSYVLISAIISAGAIFVWLGPSLFDWFIGDRFHGATSYFRWLAAAATCMGVYYIVAPYIPYVGRNIYSSITSLAALGVGVGCAILLGSANGPIGVAQASFITALFELGATAYFAQRCVSMPWLQVLVGKFARNRGGDI